MICLIGRPELFDWSSVEKKTSAIDRLEHAFNKAEQHLGIERLLDPEGNTHTHTHIFFFVFCFFYTFQSCALIGPN